MTRTDVERVTAAAAAAAARGQCKGKVGLECTICSEIDRTKSEIEKKYCEPPSKAIKFSTQKCL